MAHTEDEDRKTAAEKFNKMFRAFGDTVSEILEDPAVREKAIAFSESVMNAATKIVASKIRENEVKARFRNVGKATESLGKSITTSFEKE